MPAGRRQGRRRGGQGRCRAARWRGPRRWPACPDRGRPPRAGWPRSAQWPVPLGRARPRGPSLHSATGAFPVASAISRSSSSSSRGRGQLAGEQVRHGQEEERELQEHERARVAGGMVRASGQDIQDSASHSSRATIWQALAPASQTSCRLRDRCRRSSARSARVPGAGPARPRRTPRVSRRAKRVEKDVHRTRWLRTGRRGARGLGRFAHAAGAVKVAGPDCGDERFQVRLARQGGLEPLQAPGGAEQQPRHHRCCAAGASRSGRAGAPPGRFAARQAGRPRPRLAVSAPRPARRRRAWPRPPPAAAAPGARVGCQHRGAL